MKLRSAILSLVLFLLPGEPARAAYAYALQHHQMSTRSAAAQLCFDRGLTLFYAYNRLASRRAFECAAKADPTFAMAYWGIALAHGSNINVTVDAVGEKAAYTAIHRAMALDGSASGAERAYIRALASRYSDQPKPDLRALAIAYKQAMGELVTEYPDDPDAATLYAESMMELQPWQMYSPAGSAVGGTSEIVATLESVLARQPLHIGANHFYIHAMEASLHPERALVSAARLSGMQFEAAAAHFVHMPAHIYMRTGDFSVAAQVNEHASMHDMAYLHGAGEPDAEFSWVYHDHNLTMLAAAYSNEGSWVDAKRVAGQLTSEGALVPAMFVYLRFGRWEEMLQVPKPKAAPSEPVRIPIWHFARGMAFAGKGRLSDAESELASVQDAKKTLRITAWPGSYNSSDNILGIAFYVLAAKIALAKGDRASATSLLRSAVGIQDNLLYIEPPDWYFPVRESLGGVLFASGDYAQAAQVFRDDLRRNARNPRSLFGLYACLKSQGKDADSAWVGHQFNAAWKNADTQLEIVNF